MKILHTNSITEIKMMSAVIEAGEPIVARTCDNPKQLAQLAASAKKLKRLIEQHDEPVALNAAYTAERR